MTAEQMEALGRIARAAVEAEAQTACPAELSAAQAILESGWLKAAPGNNCFGIKATDEHATYQVTKEYLNGQWKTLRLAFEAYGSLTDCFLAHARLIQGGRYADAWRVYEQSHDLAGLVDGIAGIYATDPGYAKQVKQLAAAPYVAAAVMQIRNAMQVSA